jgi:hypothetical protein
VLITAREVTMVGRGRFPTPPRRLSDALFRQYMEGIEFIGAGASESLTGGYSLAAGQSVPQPDRAAAAEGIGITREQRRIVREPRDASGLIHQPPAVFGPGGKLRITF